MRGFCPHCGSRTLFTRVAALNDACPTCGLDVSAFKASPRLEAMFGMVIAIAIGAAAIAIDVALRPPLLLHLLWFPITMAAIAGAFRLVKGWRVARAYRAAVKAGRLEA